MGHLAERCVYDRLRRTYWWQGTCMRTDVRKHCWLCVACATRRGTGRASHPSLQPIAVGGPFHTVGVDILKLPQTYKGNQYVVVFLNYLTKWVEAFPVADYSVLRLWWDCLLRRSSVDMALQNVFGPIEEQIPLWSHCQSVSPHENERSEYSRLSSPGQWAEGHQTLIQMLSLYIEQHGRGMGLFSAIPLACLLRFYWRVCIREPILFAIWPWSQIAHWWSLILS